MTDLHSYIFLKYNATFKRWNLQSYHIFKIQCNIHSWWIHSLTIFSKYNATFKHICQVEPWLPNTMQHSYVLNSRWQPWCLIREKTNIGTHFQNESSNPKSTCNLLLKLSQKTITQIVCSFKTCWIECKIYIFVVSTIPGLYTQCHCKKSFFKFWVCFSIVLSHITAQVRL